MFKEDALRSILQHVDSHAKLDIVLFTASCPTPVSLADIARGVDTTRGEARRMVSALCSSGILTSSANGYACLALDDAVGAQVVALVRAYVAEPLVILGYLGEQALRRRSSSARRGYGSMAGPHSYDLQHARKR